MDNNTAFAQLVNMACGGLNFGAPSFLSDPYLSPELYEGDVADIKTGVLSQTYPSPTLGAVNALLNGVSQGTGYTTVVGDAGKTLQVQQTATAGFAGTVTHSSSAVVIQAFKSFGNMGYRGGNMDAPAEYAFMRMFGNAVFDSRGFASQSNSYPIVAGATTLNFDALSGSGVHLTLNTNVGCLSGNNSDVGLIFQVNTSGTSNGVGIYATVTAFGSTTTAVVTITGTLPSLSFNSGNWYMTLPTDSNGWPLIASNLLINAIPSGGGDGQLVAGTYYGTFTEYDTSHPITVTGSGANFTVTDLGLSGAVHTFRMVIAPGGSNSQLSFSGRLTNLVVSRDGTAQTSVQQFSQDCLTYHAQFDCLRYMDAAKINSRLDRTWTDAEYLNKVVPQSACQQGSATGGGIVLSWETLIDFSNAAYLSPGSKLRAIHICIPLYADSSYYIGLSNLLTSRLNSNIMVYVEAGNEEWNPGFVALNVNQARGEVEAQVLANYGSYNYVSSVSVAVGGVVTVNTSVPLSTLSTLLGVTFTTGTQFAVSCQGSHSTNWNMLPTTAGGTGVATIQAVTGASQFTYQGLAGNTDTSVSGLQYGMFFNLTSTLVADGLSFNVFYLTTKWHVRRTYLASQAWTRPQDRFLLGLQFGAIGNPVPQNGANTLGGITFPYQYAYYLGTNSVSWFWGNAAAPYINAQFWANVSSNVFSFPTGLLADGDAVGIGSNSAVATVVRVSVSGTTATVQGSSTFAVSSIVGGSSSSTMTVTSTTDFLGQGQTISGSGVTTTTISSQVSGTPGGAGVYTIAGVQTTGALSGLTCTPPTINNSNIACTIFYPNAAGSGARLVASMVRNLQPGQVYYQQIQTVAYQAFVYGKKFYCYEGGPDISVTAPNMQLTAQNDGSMATLVGALLDACFKQGCTVFNWYKVTPAPTTNGTNGGWNICQSYTDQSTKLVAYLAYNTTYGFATQSGSPGTALAINSPNYTGCTYGSGAGAGNLHFNSATVENFFDSWFGVSRTYRFNITLNATDSVRSGSPSTLTQVSLYLDPTPAGDGTLIGTTSIPANGAGLTSAAMPCPALQSVLTSGNHVIRARLHANASQSAGFYSIGIQEY